MNEHLRRMLRKVNTKIKLLSRVRSFVNGFCRQSSIHFVCFADNAVLLYASCKNLGYHDKEILQYTERAQKVIYGLQETNRSELISINNYKKIKGVIQMLKCRQGTPIPARRSYANNIDHQHETRNNKSLLRRPLVKTETAKRSLYFQGPSCCGELPRDMCAIKSMVLFKSRVKEHFLS